jgi:very-short-patch-repair endonuclease
MTCIKLCGDKTCEVCFNKSFASIPKSQFIIDKSVNPLLIYKHSHNFLDFNCNDCKHDFKKKIENVTRGTWCSFCSSKKLCEQKECQICLTKSFASNKKSKYWSDKNVDKPRMCFSGSNKKFLFNCDCGHEFESNLSNISQGKWCPYCSNPPTQLCDQQDCDKCFNKSFASHQKAEFWSNKNNLLPRKVFKNSSKKYYFDCSDCNHTFESVISHISGTKSTWCSYCAGKKLCHKDLNCISCTSRSFASHPKSEFWSSKNKDNEDNPIKPNDIFKFTHDKYWFDCSVCGHDFESSINHISNPINPTWCPYCSESYHLLCDNNDCDFCFKRSFASHEKSIHWSKSNSKLPRQVTLANGENFLFDCPDCHHELSIVIYNITNNNSWCCYCTNQTLCEEPECYYCPKNSFKNHDRSIFWSDKNIVEPYQVHKGTNCKYWFKCDQDHHFEISINKITSRNQWCGQCKHKTEAKLLKWLQDNYSILNIESQARFDWCRSISTNYMLPFDFLINDLSLIIELDGPQHFMQISNWNDPIDTIKKDIFKMRLAQKHNYTVIRLLQFDVLHDINNWENNLHNAIKKYDVPTIITIAKDSNYDPLLREYNKQSDEILKPEQSIKKILHLFRKK